MTSETKPTQFADHHFGWAFEEMISGEYVRLPGWSKCAYLSMGAISSGHRAVLYNDCNGQVPWQGKDYCVAEDMAKTGWVKV